MSEEIKQGTDAWKLARCGSLGASRIADVVAKTRTGYGASRANLMAELIAERLTGLPYETFQSAAMLHGTETEPQARAAYAFLSNMEIAEVGIIKHPSIAGAHASPDGFISDDGLIEVKCPNTATHIESLLGAPIDARYIKQMQWQMACTGRRFCEFVSFDPRLPEPMQMDVRHVVRDGEMIAMLEKEAAIFLAELDAKVAALTEKYLKAIA